MHRTFAAAWEACARRTPDTPALLHGASTVTWAQFDRRATALAGALLDAGLQPGDGVAQYLRSGPEYLETVFACFKAGLVPVNTNYRYLDDELTYLWGDADVRAVVFHAGFLDTVQRIRPQMASVREWVHVPEDGEPAPEWAHDYEPLARGPAARELAPQDEDYLLYTGGTTGLPRGVIWRQEELLGYLLETSPTAPGRIPGVGGDPYVHLCASPLMHGTGSFTAFQALSTGGTVVTLASHSFEPQELLDAVAAHGAQTIALVGDAFCLPLLAELDRDPQRWSLASLRWIVSSGAAWSADVKARLLAHAPQLVLIDSLSSSEAPGMASAITTRDLTPPGGTFTAGPATLLVDEDHRPMEPGSPVPGLVAVAGHLPAGYFKDPERTAATFFTHDGRRHAVPGDWALLAADRTLRLLGRGAACINTGGEKVFAEEVEDALRAHDGIDDAVVIGLPDPRLGQRVVAVVQRAAPDAPSEGELQTHVKDRLAGYKAPKQVLFVDRVPRGPSGKVDYEAVRATATADTLRAGSEPKRGAV